jgi:hypothetical protein
MSVHEQSFLTKVMGRHARTKWSFKDALIQNRMGKGATELKTKIMSPVLEEDMSEVPVRAKNFLKAKVALLLQPTDF